MQFLKKVQNGLAETVNLVVDKNRKIALISAVKDVIRDEEARADEAFIALGKYYYHNLRDRENDETEFYCAEVDYAERRLQRAELKLQELTSVQSQIEQYEDDAFEDFIAECEACEAPAEEPAEAPDWIYSQEPTEASDEAESGMDVDVPPQVRQNLGAETEEEV